LFLVLGVGDVDGVAVGDKVVCRKYAGQVVGDEEYIFNEEDVLCVVYD
jgi:co-chaperonin GroES (HSP10)